LGELLHRVLLEVVVVVMHATFRLVGFIVVYIGLVFKANAFVFCLLSAEWIDFGV